MKCVNTSTDRSGIPPGGGALAYLKETASNWMGDNAMRLSAALSLYTILSLAPLLVITIKVLGILWRNADSARANIMHQLTDLMGSDAAKAVQPMLNGGAKHGSGLLASAISFVVLIFSATGVFIELQDSMNTIWGVKPKPNQGIRGFVRNRLLSVGMVFGIAFLLLVSMFVSAVLEAIAKHVAADTKWLAFLLDIVVSFGVITVLFAGIFKFLPDAKVRWKHVWLGAVLTACLFTVGKYGLALYFKYGTPTSAFGAAGSLAAVLLWVYYSSFILFFGAEFTKVWALAHDHAIVPDDHAVKVNEQDASDAAPSKAPPQQSEFKVKPANTASAHVPVASAPRGVRLGTLVMAAGAGAVAGGLALKRFLDRPCPEIQIDSLQQDLSRQIREMELKALAAGSARKQGIRR